MKSTAIKTKELRFVPPEKAGKFMDGEVCYGTRSEYWPDMFEPTAGLRYSATDLRLIADLLEQSQQG